ncbi:MAG: DUF4465 domain-containing protein [Tidjanibacter sp.]|nr:DUF4465 domain-containing protein [Tidjanibacter sp.]MBR4064780.1 DUF4465 domain-containing protein [Tidjanibacter sp.]
MKKSLLFVVIATLIVACQNNDPFTPSTEPLVVTGYNGVQSRTAFGTPDSSVIPYIWSAGDRVWLGGQQSSALTEDSTLARFEFDGGTAIIGSEGHIFYNMTDEANSAKVLATQSADGNLGNDGDFGYALLDEFNTFCLEHKTAYIWFDTKTTDDDMPKLNSIKVSTEGASIAGERTYNVANGDWDNTITSGSSTITLNFEGGKQLQSANEGVMAAMVVLPAEVAGTKITVVYTFADGSTFTEIKSPSNDFTSGATQRIVTTINKENLVAPGPAYELRVLTFEDEDKKFSPYTLDYAGVEITKWSDLIDDPQYGGPLMYGDCMTAMYTWYDQGNTELTHTFPDNYSYCYWGGGHAISNYWGAGWTDEDRNNHIAKYYGEDYVMENAGNDSMLGWFNVQLMIPVEAHSGENFAVHYGYKDEESYIENLPEVSFADDVARVIDHMWVTNTNYTLNQLYNGVKSEEGNNFGGNWEGLTEDAWLKLVAQGFDEVDADADAEPISEVEFYLVQGENVVTDWEKWDLSGLGAVKKVRFNFLYSDEMGGRFGFTIPGYFAYDDIAVRFEK